MNQVETCLNVSCYLSDIVVTWDPDDLMTSKKDQHNVQRKLVFSSPSEYQRYYMWLLLEELKAEIVSQIEKSSAVLENPIEFEYRGEESTKELLKFASFHMVSLEVSQAIFNLHNLRERDIVLLWSREYAAENTAMEDIPKGAVFGIIDSKKTGSIKCKLIVKLYKFPQESENACFADDSKPTLWMACNLSNLTTASREFDALKRLLECKVADELLNPKHVDSSAQNRKRENPFLEHIARTSQLNSSQKNAVSLATTAHQGIRIIHGPPGTGKTKTILALLNAMHISQYHIYYEGCLRVLQPRVQEQNTLSEDKDLEKRTLLLREFMKNIEEVGYNPLQHPLPPKPRILVCAPSNGAVDEILSRIISQRFLDGNGNRYSPEVVRIGTEERISEKTRHVSAETQAINFINKLCTADAIDESKRNMWLNGWRSHYDHYIHQCRANPLTENNKPDVLKFIEELERLEKDKRRFEMAVSENSLDKRTSLIAQTYVEAAQIVFTTLSGSASLDKDSISNTLWDSGEVSTQFKTVIVDEAAQASELSCLVPLVRGPQLVILCGDPNQLPATVFSSGSLAVAYSQSLLERMYEAGAPTCMLNLQYRMHPEISHFPRHYFYEGRLHDGENVLANNRLKPYHSDESKMFGPFTFINISEGTERRSDTSNSIFNISEAKFAANIFAALVKKYPKSLQRDDGKASNFGVVTPYKAQLIKLRQEFKNTGLDLSNVEIDTVDSFQGREKDFVIFSCVRSQNHGGIGFLKDIRRMNVGITRARYSLVILGNANALRNASKDWDALINSAEQRNALLEGNSSFGKKRKMSEGGKSQGTPQNQISTETTGGLKNVRINSDEETVTEIFDSILKRASQLPNALEELISDIKLLVERDRISVIEALSIIEMSLIEKVRPEDCGHMSLLVQKVCCFALKKSGT